MEMIFISVMEWPGYLYQYVLYTDLNAFSIFPPTMVLKAHFLYLFFIYILCIFSFQLIYFFSY